MGLSQNELLDREKFEAWLFLDQTKYDPDELRESEIRRMQVAFLAGKKVATKIDYEVLSDKLKEVASTNYEMAMGYGVSLDNFARTSHDATVVLLNMIEGENSNED